MSSTIHLAALHALPGMTSGAFSRILESGLHQDPVLRWTPAALRAAGVLPDRASMILESRSRLDLAGAERVFERFSIQVITIHNQDYPNQLRQIAHPPPILYIRGQMRNVTKLGLAVVGTRNATPYGLAVTKKLVSPIATQQVPIISGLAFGIDAAAHRVALEQGGNTVAVLGTGIDLTYPWDHRQLAKDIVSSGGALISEFPLGSGPDRHHFPQRNRIISGLSKAVLLVEAGDRSGALITAKFALEQNRDVLVVPGSILSEQSVGVMNWLKLGATPVTTPDDIFRALDIAHTAQSAPTKRPKPQSPDEAILLPLLDNQPVHVDELTEKSRLDSSRVSATLVLMELRGIVRHHGGMHYSLTEL